MQKVRFIFPFSFYIFDFFDFTDNFLILYINMKSIILIILSWKCKNNIECIELNNWGN
ncbi:hypothetical protein RhiirA1_131104 [Rhizophagus irregularis]|uniref:Uncharacterized protein n=2 Tax=Rhizophagus irregularis TaxID=588596 RepID=A0A2N0S0Z8_9GLOM|nr:hypothetical protein RhiirA1_131104 [Rhizophagus irregularis]GBC48832.1 hypothetical protein RIR_e20698_A0A2N0S0Z8_9GLOM [Rhizophagus irregularis DAOM 181602=DAOM 197198]